MHVAGTFQEIAFPGLVPHGLVQTVHAFLQRVASGAEPAHQVVRRPARQIAVILPDPVPGFRHFSGILYGCRQNFPPRHHQHGTRFDGDHLGIGVQADVPAAPQLVFAENLMYGKQPDVFLRRVAGQRVHRGIQLQQSPPGRFVHPFRRVIVPVEDDPLVLPDRPHDQVMQRLLEIVRRFQLVGELAQAFRHDGVQHHVRRGDGSAGSHHSEFKLVPRKREGRSPVPVRRIPREFGQHMHADSHVGLFPSAVIRSLFDGLQNLRQLVSQENGDDGGRRLEPAQAVIVSRAGDRGPQHILILVHCLDHAHQEKQELRALVRAVPRLHQIVTGIRGQAPVIVFSASVHALERFFVQKAHQPVPAGHLFHDFHGQLIMVAGHVRDRVDRRHLVLGRSCLVMLGFRQNSQLPQLFVQLGHEGLHPRLDGSEKMIPQLLSLRSARAEKRPAGKNQIAAAIVQLFIHQKIFLLGADAGNDPGGVRPPEQLQDPYRLAAHRLHGAQQGRLLVQRLTAVGAVCRGNAEGMLLDKGIGRGIPRGITPRLEGGAKAATGQAAGVRFTADQLSAAEFVDDLAPAGRSDERVVLFRRDAVQRLKPVGIVSRPVLQSPVLHGVGHDAGHLGIQPPPVVNRLVQRPVRLLRQPLPHDLVIENIDPENLIDRSHGNLPRFVASATEASLEDTRGIVKKKTGNIVNDELPEVSFICCSKFRKTYLSVKSLAAFCFNCLYSTVFQIFVLP